MGFIQRIRSFFNLSVSDPKAWNPNLWNLVGQESAGENVSEETALTYSAYWCAVNLLSSTISSLPLHLMQKSGKDKRIYDDIPLYTLMHSQWNPFMTAKTGRQTIAAHVFTWGNGYAEKVLNGYGEVVELWPIPPDRVVRIEMYDGDLLYGINVGGETRWLPRRQVLHLHGLGFDGFVGYSVVAMARKTLGLGMAMETFGSNLFSQGINPGAIVTHPASIKNREDLQKALTIAYSGLGKTHRLMLLEEGMTFDRVGIPPNDSQFIESRQFTIGDVARWLNIPLHKLHEMTKSSFNNISEEQVSYVVDSVLPWLTDFEQEYWMQLLTKRQQGKQLYWKHIVEGLLRGDSESRAKFYEIMVRNGIFTRNEVREKEDMNPHPNPMADELTIEANMQVLGQAPTPANINPTDTQLINFLAARKKEREENAAS